MIALTLTRDEAKTLLRLLPKTVRSGGAVEKRTLFGLAVRLYAGLNADGDDADSSHRDEPLPIPWAGRDV